MSMRAPILVLLVVAAVLTAAPPVHGARGTWYDAYLDGIEALGKGDPERAIELLETALSRRGESGYHRTYGTNFIHYAPHAHLALAHGAEGDCSGALSEIEAAQAAGELTDDPSLAPRIAEVRLACAPPPPAAPAAATTADPERNPKAQPPPVQAPPSPPRLDPALIERGLASYFAGDLDAAEKVFGKLEESAPDSAVAHLLVATVRFARWSAGGRRDEALARSVRSALENARRLDPLLEPPPALCPPELVARWRALR